jgi:oxygen-independent coproporphyrinogen-3 oxidase
MAKVISFPGIREGSSVMQSVPILQQGQVLWDEAFIKQHDVAGPRYTSYPTALQFHEEFTVADYERAIQQSNESRRPLSLYLHLPFCQSLCHYCACNKVVTQNRERMRAYLDHLIQEIRLVSAMVGKNRPIVQMHWGGGTPTYFDDSELTELMYHLGRHFNIATGDRAELSVEIDPRTVNAERLGLLRGLGFNRVSFGVQDFDLEVQRGINRIQSFAMVSNLVASARSYKFKSINLDLIYGLPHQSVGSVAKTVDAVIQLSPDRISLFNYAHLPARFKAQGLLDEAALPPPDEKLKILCTSASRLMDAGYVHIGMDHFAKPDDELAVAYAEGELHRNFQGYTTNKTADLLGLGVSSISQIGDAYCQNSRSITEYQDALDEGQLPVVAGIRLTREDVIRRDVIMSLICQNILQPAVVGARYGIDFDTHFAGECALLKQYVSEDLLTYDGDTYAVTPRGRLVVRKICMAFDAYLPEHLKTGRRFSRVL